MSCNLVNSGLKDYSREGQCSLQCFDVHESFFDLLILFMLFVCSYIYSENAIDLIIIIYHYKVYGLCTLKISVCKTAMPKVLCSAQKSLLVVVGLACLYMLYAIFFILYIFIDCKMMVSFQKFYFYSHSENFVWIKIAFLFTLMQLKLNIISVNFEGDWHRLFRLNAYPVWLCSMVHIIHVLLSVVFLRNVLLFYIHNTYCK